MKVALLPYNRPSLEFKYSLVPDVQQFLNHFMSGGRVFHETDLHFICAGIRNMFDIYRREAKTYEDMVKADDIAATKYFIRIVSYGTQFKFVLMMKSHDGIVHNFYYNG